MKRILFLCTRNSCRSQMAEGWARHLHSRWLDSASAGSEPSTLDQRAVEAMAEVGVDISAHASKSIEAVGSNEFDHVFTLCAGAHDRCPVFPGSVSVVHRGFDDPQRLLSPDEGEVIEEYRRVRDEIGAWVTGLTEELGP